MECQKYLFALVRSVWSINMYRLIIHSVFGVFVIASSQLANAQSTTKTFAIPDTGQIKTYSIRHEIEHPKSGETWNGQDGQYEIDSTSFQRILRKFLS